MRQSRGLDCAMVMQMTQETKVCSIKQSVNSNKYASVPRVWQYTRMGIIWPFIPSHMGGGPVVFWHNRGIFRGFLCWVKIINSPANPSISYLPTKLCPEDNKGVTELRRHTKRGTCIFGSQLSVTSFLMISMADGTRQTHMCPMCLRLVSPAAPVLCLGFWNYPQDYPPLGLLLSYHILQSLNASSDTEPWMTAGKCYAYQGVGNYKPATKKKWQTFNAWKKNKWKMTVFNRVIRQLINNLG